MRPVDNATFIIPLVLAGKPNGIACTQVANFRRQIDVVGDQHHRPITADSQQKALMARTFVVIPEHLNDNTCTLNLDIATLLCISLQNRRTIAAGPTAHARDLQATLLPYGVSKNGGSK